MRRGAFLAGSCALAAAAAGSASAAGFAGFDGRSAVPVVRVRAGSRELRMAVDTGDALSTLSRQAADALGLTAAPVPNGTLARGTLSGATLAGATLRDHGVLVMTDVSNWTSLVGFPVDGSLGYEAFKDTAVTLDFKNRRLSFPAHVPEGERTAITWLKYHDRSPQLITFDGLAVDGTPVTAQFDTAMSKNAILFTTKLPDIAILPDNKAPLYEYEEATLKPGRIGSLRLNTTLLAASPLIYAAGADAHVPTTALAAVVGDQLFAQRAVTLDFPGSALIVS
jgi:hypothetical protein